MRRGNISAAMALAAGAIGGIAGGTGQTAEAQAATEAGKLAKQGGEKNRGSASSLAERAMLQRAFSGGIGVPRRGGYRNRAGWTNARYRRAAAKKRNQARNRKAGRS